MPGIQGRILSSSPLMESIRRGYPNRTQENMGLDTGSIASLTSQSGTVGTLNLNDVFDELMGASIADTKTFLKGEIPQDVVAQIEQVSAEKALASGIGQGSAARNLTARDLGLTSMDVRGVGFDRALKTAQLVEGKREFGIQSQARIDEFNKSYSLERAKFMEATRQLDLTGIEMEQRNRQFNAEQTLRANQLISEIVLEGQRLQVMWAQVNKGAKGKSSTKELTADVKALTGDIAATVR